MKAISMKPAGTALNLRRNDYFKKIFVSKKSFQYLCSAKTQQCLTLPRSRGYRLDNIRAFFMLIHKRLRLLFPLQFPTLRSDNCCDLAITEMTAVFLSIMPNHNSMKTISMKPAGTALNFRSSFANSKFFANFAVQQNLIVKLSRTGAVNARNTIGLFLRPIRSLNLDGCLPKFFVLVRDTIRFCCNGRQPFLSNATKSDNMKAISMKPAGTALNFRINARISKFFANFGMQTVASMAFISFIAAALEAQTVAIAAAIIATATIGIINKPQKGGDHE